MLGLLVIIVISWVLLCLIEKKNIDALGIIPYGNRIIQFLIGMFFIALIVLLKIYIESLVLNVEWKIKPSINFMLIFDSFIYHLKSALTEDLIFRGAIFYILINKLGSKWAILISAIVFGVYHIFSYGMINDRIVPIAFIILVTGVAGYVWAYTFYKTKSIMLALGFHLGSNLVMTFFYSSQPYGELIFTEISRTTITSEWNNLYYSLFIGLFPSIITYVFVKLLTKYNLKLIQQNQNT